MTTETINGLHKCQPKYEPHEGETKSLVVLQMPPRNGKKAWIKIKNEPPDKGGSPYRIVSVTPTGWTDEHGNISYNLEVEALSGGEDRRRETTILSPATGIDRDAPPSQQSETRRPISKDEYWNRKLELEIEKSPQILRMHSQSMALEVLKLKAALNQLTLEDLTPMKLRSLADYFDQDVLTEAQ